MQLPASFILFSAFLLLPGKCTAPYYRLAGWRFREFIILGLNYVGYGELGRLFGSLSFSKCFGEFRLEMDDIQAWK